MDRQELYVKITYTKLENLKKWYKYFFFIKKG